MSRTNRLGASIVDLTFAIWALALPTALSYRVLNSDGDLARHIRVGEAVVQAGPRLADTWSHTKAGAPFLAYEWLSQSILALVHSLGGLAAVTLFAAVLLASAYAGVVLYLRRRGAHPLLAYLTGILAALLGSPHWSARPHLFTIACLVVLLYLIDRRRRSTLVLLVPLFAFWANVHPGFVLGLVVLGVYGAGVVGEARLAGERDWREPLRFYAAACAIAAAATLLNPWGPGLHLHITGHLSNPFLMAVTHEFMSPDFHDTYGALLMGTILLVLAALAWRRQRLRLPVLGVLLLTLTAALVSMRNAPLFGLLALPLLAIELDGAFRSLRWRALVHVRGVFEAGEAEAKPGRYAPWLAALLVVLALTHGRIGAVQVVPDRFDDATFPVAAVERARAADLGGRIYNEFTWGGYLVYAWPEQPIYIDGLTDFFGEALTREYLSIATLEPGWQRLLEARGIDMVLIQPHTPLAAALADAGWSAWYEDDVAVLYRRAARPQRSAMGAQNSGSR